MVSLESIQYLMTEEEKLNMSSSAARQVSIPILMACKLCIQSLLTQHQCIIGDAVQCTPTTIIHHFIRLLGICIRLGMSSM